MAVQPQSRPKFRIALYPVERLSPTLKNRIKAGPAGRPDGMPMSVERVFFLVRWLVVGLGFAIEIYLVGSSSGGVKELARALQMTGLMAVFTGLFGLLRYNYTSIEARQFLAVLDAIVIALVIGLDGGIYSPFQFLSYLIIAEAALVFSTNSILSYTFLVGALYAATVLLISGQKWSELSITIVMTQVVAMFIVASISSSLVKAIHHQRELAHREQALSTQLNHQVNALSALNRLSERLNASLNIEELMQSTLEILPDALDVDAAVGLLARHDEAGKWEIDSVWYGIDEAFSPAENILRGDESDLVQAGPLVLSRSDLETVLVQGQPLRFPLPREAELEEFGVTSLREPAVLIVPLRSEAASSGVLALLRQNGPAFEQSDQELLAALGRHLAVLLKNARLYELERQNVARLQELEQMKSDFLSAVSHELRTPLTSIKASTILLLSQPDGEVDATELTLYKNIDRNTERLNGLVTDLLDLAKLQNGRLRLSLQSVNPVEIIHDVIASLHPLTDSKKQILTAHLPAVLPVVTADRRRVEQILTNLVSNAQRYTPRGSLIEVSAWEEAGEVIIKVRDNGPGIDPAEQALIFEKFYRSHHQQGKGGTGLGLAIARSLVELHNGRIWLESAPGEGSSFYFSLPTISSELRVQSSELSVAPKS